MAFSYGVSYSEYLIMSPNELNDAILGGQLRESRQLRLPRIIALMIGKYIGAFKSKLLTAEKFYPLPFDTVKKKETKADWERAQRVWDKIDQEKARK